jgi:hypothetical protein
LDCTILPLMPAGDGSIVRGKSVILNLTTDVDWLVVSMTGQDHEEVDRGKEREFMSPTGAKCWCDNQWVN